MTMSDGRQFHQFVGHQLKRKRAGVVCVACHAKKVKCDLEQLTTQGYRCCTNCAAIGKDCQYRLSNRDKHRKLPEQAPLPHEEPTLLSENTFLDGSDSLPNTPNANMDSITSQPAELPGAKVNTEDGLCYLSSATLDQEDGAVQGINHVIAAKSSRPQEETQPIQPSNDTRYHARRQTADSYLGQTGFLELYGPEARRDADDQMQHRAKLKALDLPPPDLQQAFEEAYFEFCYTWCPVLDRSTLSDDLVHSPLLVNALSLAASHIQPPAIPCAGPATYYDRVKQMFYGDEEQDLLSCLRAITLTYWWSPQAPSRVHRDSSWWWTTVAIRHAQHGGFHREPHIESQNRMNINLGLRRRIWWTLFARERLTALCQDRPCVINPDDCNVREPSLDDFPEKDIRAQIFICWVKVCGIIGRIAQHLSRSSYDSCSFPVHLAKELIDWVQTLPHDLILSITSNRTTKFNRLIHQLHLPYFAVIIVLHLSRSSQPLPRAYPASIVAASCVARIFKDCLARGKIRYMMPISCWYCGIALLALLQARQLDHLTKDADDDIRILLVALKELKVMWPTANIFLQGFERLRNSSHVGLNVDGANQVRDIFNSNHQTSDLDEVNVSNEIDWTHYFPNVTSQTSGATSKLLFGQQDILAGETWANILAVDLNDLFDPFDNYFDTMPALPAI